MFILQEMSDNETNPPSPITQSTGEEQRDREFFEPLRIQSTTKEQLINMSLNRLKEIRLDVSARVNELKSTIADLRLMNTDLRHSFEQMQTQFLLCNEANEKLRTELEVERNRSSLNVQQPVSITPTSQVTVQQHQPNVIVNSQQSFNYDHQS